MHHVLSFHVVRVFVEHAFTYGLQQVGDRIQKASCTTATEFSGYVKTLPSIRPTEKLVSNPLWTYVVAVSFPFLGM